MTRGDYLIHVFVEQGRQMKCPENRTVDPMIECSVLGEKKYSSIKKGITHATTLISWNEHLFFEPRNVVRNVFISSCVIVERELGGGEDLHPCPRPWVFQRERDRLFRL
jgi:hypothetical protein